MLRSTFIMLAASAPFLGYADDIQNSEQCCPLIPSKPIESCQLPVGYLYPATYALCRDINFTVSGEFLYLEVNRDGSSNIAQKIETLPGRTNAKVLIHHAGYKPAFKVGASMTLPGCDSWIFNAEYTRYNHSTTNHFTTNINEVIIPPTGGVPIASALKSVQTFNINLCNATIGRPTYFSERFILNPFLGLNSWWSSQNTNLTFFSVNNVPNTNFTKAGYWGIGPYAGIEAKGLLWWGTYVIGKTGTSIQRHSHNKYKVVINYPSVNTFNTETNGPNPSDYWNVHIILENNLGIGWGSYFCNCAYHVDFGISYYINSNYMLYSLFSSGNPTKEFYLQGLSVRGQFDF